MIESGRVDITESVDQCWFPLGEAVAKNAFDITEYLLVKGAPKTARAPIMNALISAMDMVAANADDRTELMALLKRYGATPYDGLEENLAGAILQQDDPDGAGKAKLKQDYNLESAIVSTGGALAKAMEKGHINNLRWLLQHGANPEESMTGRTGLMIAVDSLDLDKLKLLVDAGADVNRRGLNFQSVLAYAERREQCASGKKKERATAIVEYLKSKGATYSDKDRR